MKFIENVSEKEYEKFVLNHKTKSHFLQSYDWGEFSKKNKNVLIDEMNNIENKAYR